MRLHTIPSSALALAAASLTLTACGSGDTAKDDLAVAALGSQIAVELPADQALCTAEKLVAAAGVEELTKATALNADGIAQLNSQFDAKVAGQIADATVACWDWRADTQRWAAQYPAAVTEDWDAYVTCAEKLDDKLHASVVATNQKGASAKPREEFVAAQQECRKVLGEPAR